MIKSITTKDAQPLQHGQSKFKKNTKLKDMFLLNVPFRSTDVNLLIDAESETEAMDIYANSNFGRMTAIDEDDGEALLDIGSGACFLGDSLTPHNIDELTIFNVRHPEINNSEKTELATSEKMEAA